MTHSFCPITFLLGDPYKAREFSAVRWFRQWNNLKENERRLVLTMYPSIKDKNKSLIKFSPRAYLIGSLNTLEREGLVTRGPCKRCGGTGWFMHGHHCYECEGRKKEIPNITDDLLAKAKEYKKRKV